jgi:para-nitrobenzyl esterase
MFVACIRGDRPMLSRIAPTLLTLSIALCPATAFARTPDDVTIETGIVAGTTTDGVASWKGIPFAQPPIGRLRWRAPQPAVPWRGVLNATSYRSDCMQLPFPSDAAPLGTPPAEDCLYVNVWKPASSVANLPVVVWIYGGGFVNGGSSPPTYSGANLAKRGVMVVSFNYRLARFGTFATPALAREDGTARFTGNFAYLDQIAALKWVKRNIAAFGGDPANVTIVGESAGGFSVHMLVTSPDTNGLFARAVIMSGGNGASMSGDGLAGVEKTSLAFAAAKGVTGDDKQALAKLRALPADDIVAGLNLAALFGSRDKAFPFAVPYVDNIVSVNAGAAYAAGRFAKVPLMIGATSDDIGGKTGVMIAGARAASATIAGRGVPVYQYRFSYVAESIGKPGAGHASDIPFFFDTAGVKYGAQTTARDTAMADAISTYLVHFAKTGDPNGAGLPTWPRYSRSNDAIMDFAADGRPAPGKDPLGPEIDAAAQKAR